MSQFLLHPPHAARGGTRVRTFHFSSISSFYTHSPQSTLDICCQICSPHSELKKIRGVAKRHTSFTPVQINFIQSEDCDWDSLPNPGSYEESATASLINSHQRCVRQTDCFSLFFFCSLWLWLMAQALSLCHKRKETLQLLFMSSSQVIYILTNLKCY